MVDLKNVSEALQRGDAKKVEELVKQALEENLLPKDILENGLIKGMDIIGAKFKKNEVYVPEVLIAARAMHAGMDVLRPKLVETGVKNIGKVAIGTVKGDLHDIGKNLVKMMLEGAGFEVVDLGVDVSVDKFVEAVKEHQPNIIGMSALLTTTMVNMPEVIKALDIAGLRDKVKVMVGGAPITQNYANQIGADGYSPDAASAADKAKTFVA
ncbi:MAG: cobalamin-binding protein [Candidatus Infernicultor aquiphilus]|uniref:Cobalamin-binding protein n=2 Tax=Candidatus Infernicultor aquiphilus TaxID=1805029 RepID=A0A2M7PMM2_9BACT|nr:MAG: cobalamin-binding protein [Candidatus Atribacteria bacterium CG_4_10_14_3_um_filter_34_13]